MTNMARNQTCQKHIGIGSWFGFAVLLCGAGIAALTLPASGSQNTGGPATAASADWPMWGRTPSRNMVAPDAGKQPAWFSPGVPDDQGAIKPGSTANVRWVVKTRGSYSSPVVSQGRIIAGDMQCFDLATGNLLWRGARDIPGNGFCATAAIEGDRVYAVSSKGIALCLDLFSEKKGGNQGVTLWRYDLKQLGVFVHWGNGSSPLLIGDYVYLGTGNERGIMADKNTYRPLTPSLIVLDKRTGQLVARDDEQIGVRNWGTQWSSPSSGIVNGQTQIYYGGGNGVCYAFEPVDAATAAKANPDKLITTKLHQQVAYIHEKPTPQAVSAALEEMKKIEQKTGVPAGEVRNQYFPNIGPDDVEARVPDVPVLKKIWSCDCNPKEYEVDANGLPVEHTRGYMRPWHPCAVQITSTPVFYKNKVYVCIGADANDGMEGGNLVCVDATREGEMKTGEWLWNYKINRSTSTVAIADGLVYAADFLATVYCFDAETGKKYWEYSCVPELKNAHSDPHKASYGSPMLADGKLFIPTASGTLFVLATGREAKLLGKVNLAEECHATPSAAGATLVLCGSKHLWAVEDKGAVAPAP